MTIAEEIAVLHNLSTAELAGEFERLYGRKPRYRSPVWMRKRIGFKLQERVFGGLSGPARAELERLAQDIHLPEAATRGHVGNDRANRSNGQLRAGTVLQREWRDQQIRVEVLTDGFAWNGDCYGSLSAVAFAVTGAKWNGKLFFGLVRRSKS